MDKYNLFALPIPEIVILAPVPLPGFEVVVTAVPAIVTISPSTYPYPGEVLAILIFVNVVPVPVDT